MGARSNKPRQRVGLRRRSASNGHDVANGARGGASMATSGVAALGARAMAIDLTSPAGARVELLSEVNGNAPEGPTATDGAQVDTGPGSEIGPDAPDDRRGGKGGRRKGTKAAAGKRRRKEGKARSRNERKAADRQAEDGKVSGKAARKAERKRAQPSKAERKAARKADGKLARPSKAERKAARKAERKLARRNKAATERAADHGPVQGDGSGQSAATVKRGSQGKRGRRKADAAGQAGDQATPVSAAQRLAAFDADELRRDLRLACVSRAIDDREIALQKQSRVFFQISGAGHEALYLALARSLRPGHDWFFPYYRDCALMLGLGVSPTDVLLQAVGSADDPASGGRQMPAHWGDRTRNIVTQSSPTGSQCIPAVGCAEAGRYIVRRPELGLPAHGDEVTYVSLGEGATSEGEFWESLNTACTEHLPVLFVVADNGYAISVPASEQSPAPINELVQGFAGLQVWSIDGTDYATVRETAREVVSHVRAGVGPALVHARVTRPYSHSAADTQSKYRLPQEMEWESSRDPIDAFERTLIDAGVVSSDEAAAIRAEARQTVADAAKAIMADVEGKGGVFGTTHGLQRDYGRARCYNTPLSEANIIGRAVGQAIRGLRPTPEIQFFDYIWPAMQQIRSEAATIRWRSNGAFTCPTVMRVPIGGYLQGGSILHSQSGESIFAHIPGLLVAIPSRASDAAGLLRAAFRCEDPVLFLEHKHLLRQPYTRDPFPGPEHVVPLGRAAVVRPGTDLTIVTWGATVERSRLAAAQLAETDDASIEVIDLRTLVPWDQEMVAESVAKTSRLLVVHEDVVRGGFGGEIAAWAAAQSFWQLDAPIGRVGAQECHVAYAPELETAILPQVDDIATAAHRLLCA